MPECLSKCCLHSPHRFSRIAPYFEVPQPHHQPARGAQLRVDPSIPRNIVRNLFVPVRSRTTGPVPRWMPVPERAVNEHCHTQSWPRDVWASLSRRIVASPPAHSRRVQQPAQL